MKPRELRAAQRGIQGPADSRRRGGDLRPPEQLHSLPSVPTARCPLSVCLPASRFDSELTQALEEAENEREQKDKVSQENAALGAEIYTLRRSLQVRELCLLLGDRHFGFIQLVGYISSSSPVNTCHMSVFQSFLMINY